MYSEEESELRDLIIQNLENSGFLKKIKAELRAGVFLALEEDGNLRNKISLFNEKLDNFISTFDGKLMLSIVHEFLEFFNLNFTLSVFEPEVASSTPCLSRSELCDQLNIKTSDINGPIISALFKNINGDQPQSSVKTTATEPKKVPEKLSSILNDAVLDKTHHLDKTYNLEQTEHGREKSFSQSQNGLEIEIVKKSSKKDVEETTNSANILDLITSTASSDSLKENTSKAEESNHNNFFKESKDVLPSDHDPFFDEPVPSEKTSFFSFSDSTKDKPENKITQIIKEDSKDSKKSSLSSLRDLPSLTANHEWAFSRDAKNNLPSLDILKSLSSSEEISPGSKEKIQQRDSDIVESNEESSEKQVSEESIEEIIEEDEDFSAGMDDLLNSSLSLGDEVTTDQTVSQVSVVEGIDHMEPCNS